jgi:protein-tyrosine-phosphatase
VGFASGSGRGRSGSAARAVKTVLLVCHANTARSVIAQVLLERMLAERGASHGIRIRSGGIANYARDGMLPSLDARIVLREEGIELTEDGLVSTDLKRHRHLMAEADLILTMTTAQKALVEVYAEADGRPLFTLKEFAGEDGDIGDPATQGEDVFRACRDEIKRCLDRALDRLLLTLAGEPGRGVPG